MSSDDGASETEMNGLQLAEAKAADTPPTKDIDKSGLAIAAPRRYRDRDHLRYVALQPCLVCGRKPSDPHHLRFAQPRALGRKSSDEFAVPLCRIHHRLVHRVGNEAAWWQEAGIDPIKVARKLWNHARPNQRKLSAAHEQPVGSTEPAPPSISGLTGARALPPVGPV